MTVRQLLENTDSRELVEWQAYYKVKNGLLEKERKKQDTPVESGLKANLTGYKPPNMMKVK